MQQHSLFPSLSCNSRALWIDHGRGFVLLNTTIFWLLPSAVRREFSFIMLHPDTNANYMNYHDLGVIVYITIIGLMMARSYTKRHLAGGERKAIQHMVVRYILIATVGLLLGFISNQNLIAMENQKILFRAELPILNWGVMQSLGVVGLIGVLLLRFNWKLRLLIGCSLITFYQYMLLYGTWQDHVLISIHGGYLPAIFSFPFAIVIGSVVGEFLFCRETLSEKLKTTILFGAGLTCGLIAIAMLQFPQLYPNKQQATATYVMIATSITFLGLFVFLVLDRLWKKPIFLIDSFGKNAILVFVLLLLEDLAEQHDLITLTPITSFILFSSLALGIVTLDRKGIVVKL